MRLLSSMSHEFYYYCIFNLSTFEERETVCVNEKTERYYKYFEIDLDNWIDTKILKFFF